MTWSFSLLRKSSIDFFLQFSSIYLSISKRLQFSLNFFYVLQFTSCSTFLSPIFSFFLTSHSCLMFNFVEKTWQTVLIHVSQRHPWYQRRHFWDTMCEPYKSVKTISGLANPTSNHFLQFSLNFFNLLQFASCSFYLSPIFSFFPYNLSNFFFFFELCFSFEGIFSTYQPCRSNTRIKAKIPEPPVEAFEIYLIWDIRNSCS